MKVWLIIFSLFFFSFSSQARNWYRIYLDTKTYTPPKFSASPYVAPTCTIGMTIPRFERPKGALFCRMEDYLTAKTKVWIKVGVK